MSARAIKVYRNANPAMHGESLVDPHGRVFPMVNEPFLAIELYEYPSGRYRIELTAPFKLAVPEKVTAPFHTAYLHDKRFANGRGQGFVVTIRGIGVKDTYHIVAPVHTVSGTIRGFDAKPRQAYVWMAFNRTVPHQIIVASSRAGKFTIKVPQGKRLRLFVNDVSYGRVTLENWIMARELRHDVVVNPRIGGQFEFYELNAWHFDNVWTIFFLPAVVDAKIPPIMRSRDVSVRIDGKSAEIAQFTPHRVLYQGRTKRAYYPAYILSVIPPSNARSSRQHTLLQLNVDSKRFGKGEAWYIYDRTAD